MGILGWLLGKKEAVRELKTGRGWTFNVVGEGHYQQHLDRQYRGRGGDGHDLKVEATLRPDDENLNDPNAVRVEIGGGTVGYLPRDAAITYRQMLGDQPGKCSAKIVGGFELDDGSRAHLGVKLKLRWPPAF